MNGAFGGFDPRGPAFVGENPRNLAIFENLPTALPRTCGQGLRHINRIDLTIFRQEHATFDAVQIVMRNAAFDLFQRDHIHLKTKILRHRSAAQQLLIAAIVQRKRDGPVLLEPGGLPGFLFQPLKQSGGIFCHLGQIPRGP